MLCKSIKIGLKISCAVVCAVLLKQFCYKQTDGFALYKIQSDLPHCAEWETSCPENSDALDQPFYYLAKGAQSYVFASADGKTVIKFFRLYHLRPPAWLTSLSLPLPLQAYKVNKMLEKRDELTKDFMSYKIAYDEMKEETGLLMVHLNKTSHLKKQLTLYDKIGIAHRVNLDEMEFLLQKKATLVFPSVERLMGTKGAEETKQAISSLVKLLALRCEKGIFDKDPDLNTNFGFLDKTPVQIDIGRFRLDEKRKDPAIYRDEIIRITDNFRQWLDVRYPELSNHLMNEIGKI